MTRVLQYYDPVFTAKGAPVIATQPQSITTLSTDILSAYEPIVFDLTWTGSSDTTLTNVRMEAELYYGSTPVLLGTQYKKSIDVSGTTTYRFDFSDMLKTVLNPEFWNNVTTDIIQSGNENIVVPFYIDFVAKYNDAQGVEREDTTLTSGTYYAANTIAPLEDTQKFFNSLSIYNATHSSSKFLTKAPNNKTINENESEQLSFIYTGSNTLELNYELYDVNGSSLGAQTKALVDCTTENNGTLTINSIGLNTLLYSSKVNITDIVDNGGNLQVTTAEAHGYSNSDSIEIKYNSIYSGIYTISNVTSTTFTISETYIADGLGGFTKDTSETKYSKIDVWLEDSAGTQVTEKRTYLLNYGCSNGYRLWWHNSLGGVDKYTFDKYKNKTFEQSERMVYQKPLGTAPTSSDISAQTYATKGNYKYIAVSEFKSSDLEMFVDLINSTEVYYEVNPTELIAVVITSATQAVEDSEGMIQVQIEFEPSQMKKTHIA